MTRCVLISLILLFTGARSVHPAEVAEVQPVFTDEQKSFWAFQPVGIPVPPAVEKLDWVTNAIDRFILVGLEAKGLEPAPVVNRALLLRRVTFDLTGLPPTPAEVEAYLANKSEDAYASLVDRLLESPRYGEQWGRHWLDVARFGESAGHDGNNTYIYAWRYRDYVIDSIQNDKPFDQFVIEQLAGDLLPPSDSAALQLERVVATGFLQVGDKPVVMRDKTQMLRDIADEQIRATGIAFLGLTLGCARCHDHKFDPIPTADYYSLAGVFLSTHVMGDFELDSKWLEYDVQNGVGEPIPVMAVRDQPEPADTKVHERGSYRTLGKEVPRRALQIIAGEHASGFDTQGSGRLEFAKWVASADNPLTARVFVNRVWQWHFGRGLVATSDDFGIRGEEPSHPGLLDWLAANFMAQGWSLKWLHRTILLSSVYRQAHVSNETAASVDPGNRLLWRFPRLRLRAEEVRDALLSMGGGLDLLQGGPTLNHLRITAGGFSINQLYTIGFAPTFYQPRRSVYLPVVRNFRPAVLNTFDVKSEHDAGSIRNETTVPSQSLYLMNSPFVIQQATALARALIEDGLTAEDRIRRVFLTALGRSPTDDERRDALAYVQEVTEIIGVESTRARLFESYRKRTVYAPYEEVVLSTPGLRAYYNFDMRPPKGFDRAVVINMARPGLLDARFKLGVAEDQSLPESATLPESDRFEKGHALGVQVEATRYAEVSDVAGLDAIGESMTVECLIRPSKIEAGAAVGRDHPANRIWKLGTKKEKIGDRETNVVFYEFFGDANGGLLAVADPNWEAPVDKWTHVAMTYGRGHRNLYVNGRHVHTSVVEGKLATGSTPLTLGCVYQGTAEFPELGEIFQGQVDEVAVYNRVLSRREIVEHHACAMKQESPAEFVSVELLAWQIFCQALFMKNEFVYVR
jgi:hypothetical protein